MVVVVAVVAVVVKVVFVFVVVGRGGGGWDCVGCWGCGFGCVWFLGREEFRRF